MEDRSETKKEKKMIMMNDSKKDREKLMTYFAAQNMNEREKYAHRNYLDYLFFAQLNNNLLQEVKRSHYQNLGHIHWTTSC